MSKKFSGFAGCLIAAMIVSGCASLQEQRINKNPDKFAKLSSSHRASVTQGKVVEGMSRDAVYLAWGRPDIVRTGSRNGNSTETWAYTLTQPASFYGPSMRYSGYSGFYSRYGVHPSLDYCRGAGWGFGAGYQFTETISKTVEFSNDRVVAWERQ